MINLTLREDSDVSNTLREMFAATNAALVKTARLGLSKDFEEHFCLREGDYLERHARGSWRPCRILGVEHCYPNQGGGWTARLHVATLLADGRIGTGRSLTVTIGGKGRGLRGVGHEVRRRVVDPA